MQSQSFIISQKRGYLYVVMAALLWAVSGSAAKFLFSTGISPFELVQLRLTIAAAVLLAWLLLHSPARLKIATRDIGYFIILGSGAMAAVQFTYLFSISKIHVAAAILLQYLAPGFIALYTVAVTRDRLGRTTVLALVGAFSGCYLVVGAYDFNMFAMNHLGVISGFLSALAFAWYSLQGEYGMRRYHPWTVLFFALLFGAVVWNILQPPFGAFLRRYAPLQWGWIGYISLLGTLLPFGFYFKGINLIRSTRASITATLEPITAGVLSFVFLKEIMTPLQIIGGLMVIAAVILLQIEQSFDKNAPDVIRKRGKLVNSDAIDTPAETD
ncbi:MAG: EamA family transporter [Desulfobacterales bacterium]|nr:EamA family transporter [Desulfobacterales bacterium]